MTWISWLSLLVLIACWHFDLAARVKGKGRAFVKCGELENELAVALKGIEINGYTLDECLGGGAFGETWSVRSKDVVVKLLRPSITSGGDVKYECKFGKLASLRAPDGIVSCLEHAKTSIGKARVTYSVWQRAHGENLEDLLRRSGAEAPRQLAHLSDVVSTTVKVFDLMALLARPQQDVEGGDVLQFYHLDEQTSNIILQENGSVVAVDYGGSDICCASAESCEGGFDVCEPKWDKGMKADTTVNIFQLFLLMLLPRQEYPDPQQLFNLPPSVQQYFIKRIVGIVSKEDIEDCLSSVEMHMKAAYKNEWVSKNMKSLLRDAFFELLSGQEVWPPHFVLALKQSL
eukprot:TRINITY_DN28218_c0_g1_i1.p1 TRINITY_DN28218_c0_g1~~TRINITY_DN28218_c0_g1_i1.p1  ORF type:complete len:345 (-),score=54.14 TRINITY_DN28218_c0_g1_i1:32-1066(-)